MVDLGRWSVRARGGCLARLTGATTSGAPDTGLKPDDLRSSELAAPPECARRTGGVTHRFMNRSLTLLAGLLGFLAVGLGAFGAHGVRAMLGDAPDAAQRLAWWETASKYHLLHALAVGLTAVLAAHVEGRSPKLAGWLFAAGTLVFSGSLYAMTITDLRALGAVTPFGGLLLLAGWGLFGFGALALRSTAGAASGAC